MVWSAETEKTDQTSDFGCESVSLGVVHHDKGKLVQQKVHIQNKNSTTCRGGLLVVAIQNQRDE